MKPSKQLLSAIAVLQDGSFETTREYSLALYGLMRACHAEEKSLTYSKSGKSYVVEAETLCRDFVTKSYFGGSSRKHSREERSLIEKCSLILFGALRGDAHNTNSAMYEEEVEALRMRLKNVDECCAILESKVDKVLLEVLLGNRRSRRNR